MLRPQHRRVSKLQLQSSSRTYTPVRNTRPTRLASLERAKLASSTSTRRHRLRLVARRCTLELLADLLDTRCARSGVNSRSVAEVGVDADEELAVGSLDVLNDDVALGTLLAIAAGAVQLAKGIDLEAVNSDCARAVVLDDFVFGGNCAAAGDGSVPVFLKGKRVWWCVSLK